MKLSRGARRDNLFNSFFRSPSALALISMKLFNVCANKLSLSLTSDGTPSRQNLGPSGPQRIDFVLGNAPAVKLGNAPPACVKKDTLVHK